MEKLKELLDEMQCLICYAPDGETINKQIMQMHYIQEHISNLVEARVSPKTADDVIKIIKDYHDWNLCVPPYHNKKTLPEIYCEYKTYLIENDSRFSG